MSGYYKGRVRRNRYGQWVAQARAWWWPFWQDLSSTNTWFYGINAFDTMSQAVKFLKNKVTFWSLPKYTVEVDPYGD